jgi:excisionase family DNA binding protein
MTEALPRLLYSREDAAHQLSVSIATLDRLIGKKEITARRIGRSVLIPHSELVKLARRDVPVI